jgi:hypothetical protein
MLEHWSQGLQIGLWYPFFLTLGSIQGHKTQHVLVTWGRLKLFHKNYFAMLKSTFQIV